MDHVGNLLPDKDKYLKSIPLSTIPAPEESPVILLPPPEPEPELLYTSPPDANADLIKYTLYKIKDQVDILLHLLDDTASLLPSPPTPIPTPAHIQEEKLPNGRVLEGVFTGEKMRSDEGEVFDVPANYASKSKLVEGDRMKLTIPLVGSFIYKQIAPIERKRIRGELISGSTSGQWLVSTEEKNYTVLTASVTFHKGRIGDEVVLLIPVQDHSEWGAIEHIIHREL